MCDVRDSHINSYVMCHEHSGILEKKKSYKHFIWHHKTYIYKKHHITHINSKITISMEENQGLPLAAQKLHFASITIKNNSRPRSSCLFSSSWITGVWAPRLSLTLFMERITPS